MSRAMVEDFIRSNNSNKFECVVCIYKKAYEIESGRLSSLFANQKSTAVALEEAANGNLDCSFVFSYSNKIESSEN